VNASIGSHLQGLADRVDGLGGPHAQGGHHGLLGGVTRSPLLLDLQGLLDGVLVELREEPVDTGPVNGVVRLELPVGSGIGYVLNADNNVHGVAGPGPSCALDVAHSCGCGEATAEADQLDTR